MEISQNKTQTYSLALVGELILCADPRIKARVWPGEETMAVGVVWMDRIKPRTKQRRSALAAEQNRKEHFNDGSIIYLCKEKGLGHKHVQGRLWVL